MARLSLRRITRTPDDTLRRWTAVLAGIVDLDRARLRGYAAALVEEVHARPGSVEGALARFGRSAGADGWPLADVATWIGALAEVAGREAVSLRGFRSGIAVAKGWAEGFLHGSREDACMDPLTGLATLPVLELRLGQVYEQCAALGIDAPAAFALIVVDVDLGGRPPLVREAARVLMAERIKTLFRSGETAAEAHGPMAVLVSRTPELAGRVRELQAALSALPVLGGAAALVWVEELPGDARQLRRFVLELAAP
jgi:hypothetical protein